ncbi:7180_t:CDS:1, partial [Diversispora eburnea]
ATEIIGTARISLAIDNTEEYLGVFSFHQVRISNGSNREQRRSGSERYYSNSSISFIILT